MTRTETTTTKTNQQRGGDRFRPRLVAGRREDSVYEPPALQYRHIPGERRQHGTETAHHQLRYRLPTRLEAAREMSAAEVAGTLTDRVRISASPY